MFVDSAIHPNPGPSDLLEPQVPCINVDQLEWVLRDVLQNARRMCHDPGLRLLPLVSRRQPYGIAVLFEFSTSERWLLARDFGHWGEVRRQAVVCLRAWLAREGQNAFLTVEPDVRSVAASFGLPFDREEWAHASC